MELGFIVKLIEMYTSRKTLRELKQELEEKYGLSVRYVHVEGKILVDQMLDFNSTYLQEQKRLMKIANALQTKLNLKIMLHVTMLFDASVNKNLTCS